MAEVKWIKIVTDIFDDEKVLLIETLPEADSIIVIWFKLLCLAGKQNNSGVFMLNDKMPYNEKMFSTIFRRKESTVQLAFNTFEKFGMVEIIEGAVTIPNWGKHQTLDKIESKNEYMKNYMQEYRSKQKLLANGVSCKANSKANGKANVNPLDKIRKEEIRVDKNKTRNTYGEYENVLLSDQDYQKLINEFPYDYQERIERLSEYIASTGKTYKNHLATIRSWSRRDKPKQSGNPFDELLRKEIENEQNRNNCADENNQRLLPDVLPRYGND